MKQNDRAALTLEFERQTGILLRKGYPKKAGMTPAEFQRHLNPLKKKIKSLAARTRSAGEGRLPCVIVVKGEVVPAETAMSLAEREGRKGFAHMDPVEPGSFETIERVKLPGGKAYLLVDIDRGKETLNVTPEKALAMIRKKKRSPLTIDEGIAIITHFPEFLKKNNCFSLLASRRGDQRVPALWLSQKRPKLGWCWDRNPHTWLGSASCGKRIGK